MALVSAYEVARIPLFRSTGAWTNFDHSAWMFNRVMVGAVGVSQSRFIAMRGDAERYCAVDLVDIPSRTVLDSIGHDPPGQFVFEHGKQTWRSNVKGSSMPSANEESALVGNKAVFACFDNWTAPNFWDISVSVAWDNNGSLGFKNNALGSTFNGVNIDDVDGVVHPTVIPISADSCYLIFAGNAGGVPYTHILTLSIDASGTASIINATTAEATLFYSGAGWTHHAVHPIWRSKRGSQVQFIITDFSAVGVANGRVAIGTLNLDTAQWSNVTSLFGGTLDDFHTAGWPFLAVPFAGDSFVVIQSGGMSGWEDPFPGFRYARYGSGLVGAVRTLDPWGVTFPAVTWQHGYAYDTHRSAFTAFTSAGPEESGGRLVELEFSGDRITALHEHVLRSHPDNPGYGLRGRPQVSPIGNGLFVVGVPGWDDSPDFADEWELFYYVFRINNMEGKFRSRHLKFARS